MAKGVKHVMKVGDLEFNISHEEQGLPIIRGMLLEFQPELIIEFGTSKGGFTWILHSTLPDVELHTYDLKHIAAQKRIKKHMNDNVHFHTCDILSKPLPEVLKELCKDSRKKLLYCDNGNKQLEIELYSGFLNKDDIIGCHDYGKEVHWENIKDYLLTFEAHNVNIDLKRENCMSRFWVKGE